MLARLRCFVLVAVATVATPTLAAGQQPVSVAPTAGPRQAVTATAARNLPQQAESFTLMQRRSQSMGKPVALMVVGGAAVVLGAVIGNDVGTIFMIGGAVALLIGLYEYMK